MSSLEAPRAPHKVALVMPGANESALGFYVDQLEDPRERPHTLAVYELPVDANADTQREFVEDLADAVEGARALYLDLAARDDPLGSLALHAARAAVPRLNVTHLEDLHDIDDRGVDELRERIEGAA